MSRKLTVREKVYGYVKRKYGSEPEYLWRRFPDYAIFRHEDNRKWYGLIMDISAENLGLPGEGRVDILNVKLDDLMLADMLVQREGYLRGYHLNRGNWISILLDGTVPMKEIREMLDEESCIVLVNGLGGIGKTAVMQGICNDLKNEGHYVAWISCGDSLQADLLMLREAFDVPKEEKATEAYALSQIGFAESWERVVCLHG